MSKGSKQRAKLITEEEFNNNWDRIFARKKTPKHGRTLVHKDRTKIIPRREKYDRDYE